MAYLQKEEDRDHRDLKQVESLLNLPFGTCNQEIIV